MAPAVLDKAIAVHRTHSHSLSLSLSLCAWLSLQNQTTHFRTGFDLRKRIQPLLLLLLRSSCYLPAVHVLFDFSWKKSCHVVADPLISHFPPGVNAIQKKTDVHAQ